jgi:hypothetical protein
MLLACNFVTGPGSPTAAAPTPAPTLPSAATPTPVPVLTSPEVPTATVAPAPEANATPLDISGPEVAYDGIRLALPAEVASGLSARLVPAQAASPDGPFWDAFPEYIELMLVNYARPETFHQPRIEVYPVADFEAVNPTAAETIGELRQMLAEKPADPDQIPFLPLFNAGQVFRAQVKYVDFQSGTGVRFLALYAQYFAPIDNYNLFYTYQGLTADGSRYVSALLPVSAPILADTSDLDASVPAGGVAFPDFNAPDFETLYPDYLTLVEGNLNGLPDASFTPGLDAMDRLVQSIEVH